MKTANLTFRAAKLLEDLQTAAFKDGKQFKAITFNYQLGGNSNTIQFTKHVYRHNNAIDALYFAEQQMLADQLENVNNQNNYDDGCDCYSFSYDFGETIPISSVEAEDYTSQTIDDVINLISQLANLLFTV